MMTLDLASLSSLNLHAALLLLGFVLCLSLTAGGLLVVFRFRQTRRSPHFQLLQVFLILLYVYGYYGLWSGIALAGFMEIDNVERVARLLAQMGAPFYLVALGMLLLWTARVHERAAGPLFALAAAGSAVLLVLLQGLGWTETDIVQRVGGAFAIAVAGVQTLVLLQGRQAAPTPVVRAEGLPWLCTLALLAGLIHLPALSPLRPLPYFDAVFLPVFFFANTALVVIYTYQAPEALMQPRLTLDAFLLKHGISRREADILRGIYAGKTNQEIASELFISLQTVKDHSSRLYQKTHVKNRAQLSTLIRESQSVGER
jgi:DNA-binding CsgD family transcriptional regulator